MAYRNFTMKKLKDRFDLEERRATLFTGARELEPSAWLLETLEIGRSMPLLTEKAKSEWIVAPVLSDARRQTNNAFAIFSGITLKADVKRELNGECDFVISSKNTHFLEAAVFAVTEAKNDNVDEGLAQCAAQMFGARVFNRKQGEPIETIYGCVTNGNDWQFLKLEGRAILIDKKTYFLSELGAILGVIQTIAREYVL